MRHQRKMPMSKGFILPSLLFTTFAHRAFAAMTAISTSTKKGALIFLHGLGDSPAGWSSLQFTLPQLSPRLKDIEYVFPPAPTIPISINGGMKMPGWFDIFDWPIGIGVQDDYDGQRKAVQQVEECVRKLETEKGIPRNRIVIGGFSQGGAIALLAAYQTKNPSLLPFAACVNLSGWLLQAKDIEAAASNSVTPLFWGHGQYDDKVLFEQQGYGVEQLKKLGVDVLHESYPVGHSSHPKEMEAMAKFLDNVLFNGLETGSDEI